jgi:glycine/D-amino acid oxidase-like deaminating enzyme
LLPGLAIDFENPIAPVGGIYDPDSRLIAPGLAWRALAGHLNKLGVALFMNSQPQNLVLGDFGVSGFEINDMVVECEGVVATDVSFAVAAAAGLGLSIQTVESPARLFVSTPLEPFFGLSMSTLDGQMSYWQAPDGELAIETAGAPGKAALYLLSMVPALASVKTRPVAHHLWSPACWLTGLPGRRFHTNSINSAPIASCPTPFGGRTVWPQIQQVRQMVRSNDDQ